MLIIIATYMTQITDNTFRSLSSDSILTDVRLDDTCVGLVINNDFLGGYSSRVNVDVFCSAANNFLSNPALLLSGNSYSIGLSDPVLWATEGITLIQYED